MENKNFIIHPAAEKIVKEALTLSKKIFGERWAAAYVLGSLARGGFSEQDSDIDLAIFLQDPLLDSDQDQMNTLSTQIKSLPFPLAKKLSIFWESVKNIKEGHIDPKGRFPAFDRMDFFENARLLEGKEIRKQPYPLPAWDMLAKEGIQLALEKLNQKNILDRIADPASLFLQKDIPASKIILFPIRLIYTASTGKVGGNAEAVTYYNQQYNDESVLLVKQAFDWRQHQPNPHEIDFQGMKERLKTIYKRCISIYMEKMQNAAENKSMDLELLKVLEEWKSTIENL